MSERIAKPFHCAECGTLVHRAHPRPDATWLVRPGVSLPLPDDVLVPTCGNCGEWFVDGALAELIQARLEKQLALAERAEAAEMLLTHDKCRVCGGTGVYADRFAVVDCDACSATGWVKREVQS